MGRERGRLLLLAITPALLTGCHSSPEKEQEKLRQELTSWDATAQLTRELTDRGALPQVYVRQVSEAVEQGKQKLQERAAKSAP
jgi:outer membrane biogenesis lipoprotein LolB